MMDWLDMIGTYDERKVANYKNDIFEIDTCYVTDRPEHPYETAIRHKSFNKNMWIVLGWCNTKAEAEEYHNKMTEYFIQNEKEIYVISDAYTGVNYYRNGEEEKRFNYDNI